MVFIVHFAFDYWLLETEEDEGLPVKWYKRNIIVIILLQLFVIIVVAVVIVPVVTVIVPAIAIIVAVFGLPPLSLFFFSNIDSPFYVTTISTS